MHQKQPPANIATAVCFSLSVGAAPAASPNTRASKAAVWRQRKAASGYGRDDSAGWNFIATQLEPTDVKQAQRPLPVRMWARMRTRMIALLRGF